ncbi:MAG: choice-of-anchor D domain-containing protein [Flavobacterium sp.]
MKKLLFKSESLLLITLLIVTSITRGQSTQPYTANGSFVTPAGVTTVKVEAYGAGGSGGYGGTANKNGGGGGGGGGYSVINSVTVTPGTSYALTIGAGGVASTANTSASGGNTTATFGSTSITANGGAGGRRNSNGGNGGNGGNGSMYNGGKGATGTTALSGGGGGAAGTDNDGIDAIGTGGGNGGGGQAGDGADGSTTNAIVGTVGSNYGGGGSGGTKNSLGGNGAGGYMLISYTCPTYALTATTAPNRCNAGAVVVTLNGSAASLPAGNYTVTYNLSGNTTATGNTASMTVAAGSPGTGTFTTSSISAGTTNITITNLASSYCSTVITANNTDSIVVTTATPTVNAGTAITTCATSGTINITAGASATGATSVSWSTTGSGALANVSTTAACTYTPSVADIAAGSVTLTLTATNLCGSTSSNKTLTISKVMTANAGTDINACAGAGAVNITAGSSATNHTTVAWTSSGTGTFTNATSLSTCTYNPSTADIAAGGVTLTLTASNAGCPSVTSTKNFTINNATTAIAGTPVGFCALGGAVNITAGASASNYSLVTWTSSGSGTFANANSLTACTYTPSALDNIAGSVTLTLTATGIAPCTNATSTKTLTLRLPITATAGSNVTMCSSTASVNITTGATSLNHTSVTWSTPNGTGVFTNPNNLSTCTYAPSIADIAAGSVTITLTSSNGGCADVVSNKTLTIIPAATSVAGTNIYACASTAINITAGANPTNYASVTWSTTGTGTLSNANSLTNCTYTPSTADATAGSRTITLTVNGNSPCGAVTSTKTIYISRAMTAIAGTAITICASTASVNITTGSSATNQTSVTWSTPNGTGTFTNPNNLTTCTYAPSADDIAAGSVTITLTASNAGCADVTSSKTLTIRGIATSNAGTAIVTCSNSGVVNITAGASATNYNTATWTCNGTGTLANNTSLTNCTYNPTAADIAAGSRTLTLTVTGISPCSNAVSTKTITFTQAPTAVAGTAINACYSAGAVNITAGSSATNNSGTTWTSSGTGTFANANSLTTCTYTPSLADITAGSVTLTLTASGNAGCNNAVSTKTMTIYQPPVADAGTNINTCSSAGAVNITTGSSASNYTSVAWSSSGTGTFTNATSLTTCTYNPSTADKSLGTVTLTLTVTNACGSDTSTKTLTIYAASTITGTTPGTRSGAGTVNLGATTLAGTIYWYTASTGGTAVGFGTNFTTPVISSTTTYYVEAVNGPCVSSPRVAVVATVIYPEIDIQGNAVSIPDGSTAVSTANWTDFGATNTTRTFTIKNTGVGVLTLGTVTLSGANASDFTVTTAPSSSIASGSSSTFTITFNPSAAGTRVARISIDNTDADENPYDFSIQGTGVATEIDIKGNGVTIVDGSTTPSTANWTDFSTVASTRTFTIYNTGNVALTLGTPVISGADAADFAVTTLPAATVGAYGSTTFTVTFTPTAINNRTATITIANNDSDENPYDFAIQGFGVIPEIDIQGNGTSIADGTTAVSTANWTDFSNTTITRTFTIYNQGNTNLTLGAITFTGTNASDFAVTTPPVSPVTAFGSTTFTVTFTPSATGTRTAKINIVNNDSNENPYDFNLQGTGVAQEIDLQGNATSIVDGSTTPSTANWTDFGTASATRTFTILNQGNMPLTVGAITFTGTNAADFTVTSSPSATVVGFGSTTFTVTFNNGGTGVRNATMNIVNNDSNENPYDVAIRATGGTRIMAVTNPNGVNIPDNDTTPTAVKQTDFGSVSINSGLVTVTYTITNTGTAAINLGAATFTGTNAADFTMTLAPATALAPSATTTFEISFAPTSKGNKSATFAIVTNATGMNPFNFDLIGLGVQTYIDTDGDGVTDNMDLDDDNDGIKDVKEQTDAIAYPLSNFVKYTFLNENFRNGKNKRQNQCKYSWSINNFVLRG